MHDPHPVPIAVQLYTLRDETAVDLPAVLARVGAVGYAGVEFAGLQGCEPVRVSAALSDAGLRVASAHVGLGERDAFAAELDVYQGLGADTVVVPFGPPDWFADSDALAHTAERINEANEIAAARGLALGYHNHYWELQQQVDDRPSLVALFDRVDPSVRAEVDIYWAQVGGVDPADLLRTLGARVTHLHVKDGPADDPSSAMVAVGHGTVDVGGVLAAAPSASWHIVELDRCDTDMFRAVEDSYSFLVGAGLSQGRA